MIAWLLLLLVPLTAYVPPAVAGFGFYTPALLVPFAAFLGQRFGRVGFWAVAIGGLPFLLYLPLGGAGAISGNTATWLVALWVASSAAKPQPFGDFLRGTGEGTPAWMGFAAAFLLVLAAGAPFGNARVGLDLQPIGYFLIFLLGARGVRFTPLLLGLAAAALLGWTMALNGLVMSARGPLVGAVYALQPRTVLGALAMLASGAAASAYFAGRSPTGLWRRPTIAAALLVLLWLGPAPLAAIPIAGRTLYFLQVGAALPAAAFMAGLLCGTRGAWFVIALVTAVTVVHAAGMIGLLPNAGMNLGSVALEGPFAAAAWAAMGARAARMRRGGAEAPR